jgi:ferritin-like metal-binding protein YciE
MTDLTAKDTKLIQYLNEAYGKERELETALQAHIAMTSRAPYKKRLQEHLRETKSHGRQLERRIKQLGGRAEAASGIPQGAPDVVAGTASAVTTAASKAVAAAKGPLHAIRGTGDSEKMLKNAKTEYSGEFEEIATYTAIEALASEVGDRDTAKVARDIRREEERMARFLERLIPQLTRAVAREEIPAAERRDGARRRTSRSGRSGSQTRGTSRSRRASARSRGSSSRSRARGGSASTSRR